jgi:hypothetical protein
MKEKLKKEIFELLDIRDGTNFTDLELFKLLDKKRKSIHPERTTDEDVKKEYEEKFKQIQSLYKKFGEYVKAKPDEVALQLQNNEIQFDYVNAKFENDELKDKVQSLEREVDSLKSQIKSKLDTIKRLNDTKVKEETEKLKEIYKPKKNNLIFLSLSALLGLIIHILSKSEEAINIYTKYLPDISPQIINMLTLCLLLIITLIFLTNYLKKRIIQNWSEKVKTTDFTIGLFDFVKENIEPIDETKYYYSSSKYRFKERVIYTFIKQSFSSQSKFKRISRKIIGLNELVVFENFKKIVIYELLNKEIISIYGNSGFDKMLNYNE